MLFLLLLNSKIIMNNMQITASNKQVIYIFGNNDLMSPLSQIYRPVTNLSLPSVTTKKIVSPSATIKKIPLATKLSKTNNISKANLFSNNKASYPLHQLYHNNSPSATIKKIPLATKLSKTNNISKTNLFSNDKASYTLHQLYPNNSPSTTIKKIPLATKLSKTNNISKSNIFSNDKASYPLHQLYPNNKVSYPLHQLYSNNRSAVRADPFLWLFPDSDLLLDQYVPYLLQLYSQQSNRL